MSDRLDVLHRMSYWLFEAHESGGNPWPIEIPEGEGVPRVHLLGDGIYLNLGDLSTGRPLVRLIEHRDDVVDFEVPVPNSVAVDLDVIEVDYPTLGPIGQNYGNGRIIKATTNASAFSDAYSGEYWWNPDSSGYLHRYELPDDVRDTYEVSDGGTIPDTYPISYQVRIYVPTPETMVPITGTWGEILGLTLDDVTWPVERHYADGTVVSETERVPGRLAIMSGKSWTHSGTYYKPTPDFLIQGLMSGHDRRGASPAGPWNYHNGARYEETDPGPPPVEELVWPSTWPQSPPSGWDPFDWEDWLPLPWTDWGVDGDYLTVARPYPWWDGTGSIPTEWPYGVDPVLLHGPGVPLTYHLCFMVEWASRRFTVGIGVINLTPAGGGNPVYDFEWDPATGQATALPDVQEPEGFDVDFYTESNRWDSISALSPVAPTEGSMTTWPEADVPTLHETLFLDEEEELERERHYVAFGDLELQFSAVRSDEADPDDGIGGFHDDRYVDPDIGQARDAILEYLAGGTKRIYEGTLGVLPRPLSGGTETFMGRSVTADTHYSLDVILGEDGPLAVKVQDGGIQVWDDVGELLWNETLEDSLPAALYSMLDESDPQLEYRFAQAAWPHPTGEVTIGGQRLLLSPRSPADKQYLTPAGKPPVIFQIAIGERYVVYPDPDVSPYPRIASSSEPSVVAAWGGPVPFDTLNPDKLAGAVMQAGTITIDFTKILTLPTTAEDDLAEIAERIYLYSRSELNEDNVDADDYDVEFFTPYAGAIEGLKGWNVAVLTADEPDPEQPVVIEVGVPVGVVIALVGTAEL